jgi:hypothetical protein
MGKTIGEQQCSAGEANNVPGREIKAGLLGDIVERCIDLYETLEPGSLRSRPLACSNLVTWSLGYLFLTMGADTDYISGRF